MGSRANPRSLHRAGEESGSAIVIAIGGLFLVLGLGTALVLTSTLETRMAAVHRDAALVRSAADLMLERTLIELASSNWSDVLAGATSAFAVGALSGVRDLGNGTALDLEWETADLLCGRAPPCSESAVTAVSDTRPWGSRNPRWRLYSYGPLADVLPGDPMPPTVFLAAWVADDPADADGDPWTDSAVADDPGRNVMMVVVRAFGPRHVSRTIQAVVERSGPELRTLSRLEVR